MPHFSPTPASAVKIPPGFEPLTPEERAAQRRLAHEIRYRRAQKTPYGRVRWRVMRTKTSLSSLEKALRIYDPGLPIESKVALDDLTQALGLQDIEWPSYADQEAIVDEKFDMILMKALFMLGYRRFTSYGSNGRGFLRISPSEGKEPPVLPDFLRIPYLVPVKGFNMRWRLESARSNPRIETGAPLCETNGESLERMHGTLGPIMSSPLPGTQSGSTFVSLTAAHVIPDGVRHLEIPNPMKVNSYVELEVPHISKRLQGQRAAYDENTPPFFNDLGFLVIAPNDVKYFACQYLNVNVHFFDQHSGPEAILLDPLARSRYPILKKVLRHSSIIVFKKGSASDQTMGHLVDVTREPPEGWYEWEIVAMESDVCFESPQSDIVSSCSSTDEISGWFGVVKWSTVPFAAPGDSGSLVFAVESGVRVPLGIHVGSPESMPDHSVFICLEAFCLEGEKQG